MTLLSDSLQIYNYSIDLEAVNSIVKDYYKGMEITVQRLLSKNGWTFTDNPDHFVLGPDENLLCFTKNRRTDSYRLQRFLITRTPGASGCVRLPQMSGMGKGLSVKQRWEVKKSFDQALPAPTYAQYNAKCIRFEDVVDFDDGSSDGELIETKDAPIWKKNDDGTSVSPQYYNIAVSRINGRDANVLSIIKDGWLKPSPCNGIGCSITTKHKHYCGGFYPSVVSYVDCVGNEVKEDIPPPLGIYFPDANFEADMDEADLEDQVAESAGASQASVPVSGAVDVETGSSVSARKFTVFDHIKDGRTMALENFYKSPKGSTAYNDAMKRAGMGTPSKGYRKRLGAMYDSLLEKLVLGVSADLLSAYFKDDSDPHAIHGHYALKRIFHDPAITFEYNPATRVYKTLIKEQE